MEETTSLAGSIEDQFLQIKQGDEHFLNELYESKRIGFVKWFQ